MNTRLHAVIHANGCPLRFFMITGLDLQTVKQEKARFRRCSRSGRGDQDDNPAIFAPTTRRGIAFDWKALAETG